jgi:hypothetical protein
LQTFFQLSGFCPIDAIIVLARLVDLVFPASPDDGQTDDMSFLHLLFYVNAGGGVEVLHKSGLAERFDGGSQVVSDRVAQQLGPG